MNNERIKKLQLIRQIIFEARKLAMKGYGHITIECQIVEKQPERGEDDE